MKVDVQGQALSVLSKVAQADWPDRLNLVSSHSTCQSTDRAQDQRICRPIGSKFERPSVTSSLASRRPLEARGSDATELAELSSEHTDSRLDRADIGRPRDWRSRQAPRGTRRNRRDAAPQPWPQAERGRSIGLSRERLRRWGS